MHDISAQILQYKHRSEAILVKYWSTVAMDFVLLADAPEALDTVAVWYFEQWCRDSGRYSLDQVKQKLAKANSSLGAPMLVVARESGVLVGAAELKIREMPVFPDYEFWLGGVYVAEHARGKGLASALVNEVLGRAKQAGIRRLYLQTEDLSGGVYLRHGFTALQQTESYGGKVLVMVADLSLAKVAAEGEGNDISSH
jgi:GNAT superfamily N-acetyltransferase